MATLHELVDIYGTDKNLNYYTDIYERAFQPIQNEALTILEVGIGTLSNGESNMQFNMERAPQYRPGASLRVWRDWFWNSQVYGIDIQPDTQFIDHRIRTFLINSCKVEECEQLGDLTFDIIIDDGLHWTCAQRATFYNLFPRLNPNGFYIIEDLMHDDDTSNFCAWLRNQGHHVECTKEYHEPRPANLLLIRKKA